MLSLTHRIQLLILTISFMLILNSGCMKPNNGDALKNITLECEIDELWQVSKKELRSRGFSLDRIDKYNRSITTHPLTSKQWFEFWRNDVVDHHSLMQSSMQTIRRIVTIDITSNQNDDRKDKPISHTIECTVIVQKQFNKPNHSNGTKLSISQIASPPDDNINNIDSSWLPAGDDNALATAILQNIRKRL